jgi:type IV pilus assembly protein PilY1
MNIIQNTLAGLRRRTRQLASSAGAYAWMLSALLVASPSSQAVDLDIYTKALTSGITGDPVLIFQVDNSGSMLRSMVTTSTASHLMDQRLYRMADVAMAQVTGMKSKFKIGVTTYDGSATGKRLSEAVPLHSEFSSTPGVTTFSVVDPNADLSQATKTAATVTGSTSVALGALTDGTQTRSAKLTLPYVSGWPFNYAASEGFPASTGSGGQAYSRAAGLAGNAVFYYRHGGTTSTQSFRITGATASAYVAILAENSDTPMDSGNAATSGTREYTSGDCGGMATGGNDACVSSRLTSNAWYRIVVGTTSPGAVGTFSIQVGNTARMHATDGLQLETRPRSQPRRMALGFERVDIPRGATITSAYLEFKSSSDKSQTGFWRAGIDPNVLPAAAGSRAAADYPYARTWNWGALQTLNAWSNGEVGSDTRLSVTSLVQNQVSNANWCGGDMVFAVDSKVIPNPSTPTAAMGNLRDIWNAEGVFNSSSAVAPKLVVNWAAPAGPAAGSACDTHTFTFPVANVSDDIQQNADGSIVFDATTLAASATRSVGLRFPLVTLPQGVTVTDARLVITPDAGTAQPLKIKFIDEESGPPFSGTSSSLDEYDFVNTGVDHVLWTPSSWTAGTPVQSDNLATFVQALISKPEVPAVDPLDPPKEYGWKYDNAIGIVIEGTTTSASTFRAWERHEGGASTTGTDRSRYGQMSAKLVLTVTHTAALPIKQSHRYRTFNTFRTLPAIYNTPIMGTYIESAQYLLGWDNFAGQMPDLSTGDCATNGIVILTDGEETGSYGSTQTNAAKAISGVTCSTSSTSNIWACTYRMVEAVYNMRNLHEDGNKYSIRTDAIGFGPEAAGATGLAGIEGKGGGKFYLATDSAALTNAFRDIIANMSISTASVAASGVAVNALNRFEHLDHLYYSLFAPSTKIDWSGNLKRYRLYDADVKDVLGESAIDKDDTGFFDSEARSYWSSTLPITVATDKFVDGSNVSVGGAAGKTPATSRNIYTYLSATAPNNVTLADQVISSNSSITPPMLGVPGTLTATQQNAKRVAVLDYLRAAPVTDTTVRWGAAIHGSPRVVTFDQTRQVAGEPAPIITVFYADNRGLLHAIDAGELNKGDALEDANNTGGQELWAFMPKEFLANATAFYENTEDIAPNYITNPMGPPNYRWGMDGDVTVHREPSFGNPTQVWLFAGMRRGGSTYYALDVSKSHVGVTAAERTPKLKWWIKGGTGVGDFGQMGQSWSAMVPLKLSLSGSEKKALTFAGGYDPAFHDDGVFKDLGDPAYFKEFSDTAQKGRGIYIVDMETGTLITSIRSDLAATAQFSSMPAVAKMKYSMVASPRFIDRNGDGYADAIYAVDLAGQVFRIELNPKATSGSNLIRNVVLVAQLGSTGSAQGNPAVAANVRSDNRRFFEPPSVARVGSDIYVAITSGYREEPYSQETDEAFFLVRDKGAYRSGSTSNAPVTIGQLDNITGNELDEGADASKPGWYLLLDKSKAEKGIGSPIIFNFSLLFTTWNAELADVACAPDIGSTRLFLLDLKGRALADTRGVDINLPGFGDTPQILFQEQLAIAVGIRVLDPEDLCSGADCPFTAESLTWRQGKWYIIDTD